MPVPQWQAAEYGYSAGFTDTCGQCGRANTRKVRAGDGRLVCAYRRDCYRAGFTRRPVFGQAVTR